MTLKLDEFRNYLINNEFNALEKSVDGKIISFDNKIHHGEVRTHFINNYEIVELDIQNKQNVQPAFYLHFEYQNLEHAKELFKDFLNVMYKEETQKVKVLFSCSAALTTSYFAQKMNEFARGLELDYEFNAVVYTDLYKVGQDYDIVLLAPQIAYMLDKIKAVLKNQIVVGIPASVFANYDTYKMLDFIKESLKSKDQKPSGKLFFKQLPVHDNEILTLSFVKNSSRIHIYTNVYSKDNRVLLENKDVYTHVTLNDIYEKINKHLKLYPHIEAIGLSLGGFIQDNVVHEFYVDELNEKPLDTLFKDYYQLPFIYSNDITCAAVGYYANNDMYKTLCVLYQPISAKGRFGYILNGRAYNGCHNLIGDLEHLPLQLTQKYKELIKTPEGAKEVFAKLVAMLDLTIDPECIVIASQLLTDVKEIENEVHKHIQYHSAKLIDIGDHWHEYICYGQLALVVKALNKDK